MSICTMPDCENPTDIYLCPHCTRDLQAWIDQIPPLLQELPVTIEGQGVTRSGASEGANGTHKASSKAPLDLHALELKHNLEGVQNASANLYARHQPSAALIAAQIMDWVTQAERAISGPETEHINHAENTRRIAEVAPAMPTRHLVPWLRENAGITITSQNIRDWARRGHLTPAARFPTPTYRPHEVLAAKRRNLSA